ncbi:MAG: ABC transporter ATP-binding protein [Vallitaleaceae bacterium]|jgi:ABC-2 type transport system ATP-binding protein|nr:ABC transporter ATP-binding protein [Vallitaleaceae bacterium]
MQTPIVQFQNLYKNFGKKQVIKDLSFDVYPGEVFGFLGPNGAGKTTTIRMMLGLIKMTAGDVLVEGISVNSDFEKAITHVGGIVENPELYQFMTGYNNLKLYARMHEGVTDERIMALVKQVGLEHRINDKVKTYSLGMRQRLGLAQALLHDPKIIVLDEPTNGLDPAGIKEFRNYLRNLAATENVAVMVSSHILSEMELMCDRYGIIQNGELVDVRMVGQQDLSSESIKIIIAAKPMAKAGEIMSAMAEGTSMKVQVNSTTLEIMAHHEQVPGIIKTLVNGDVAIYEVKLDQKTLEDHFIELTGGGEIE